MELLELDNLKENLEEFQTDFLNNAIGEIADKALNVGIKFFLPDVIEDVAINIKDELIGDSLKDGVENIIENLKENAIGIGKVFTGQFENISQVREIIKKEGIINGVSGIIDGLIERIKENNNEIKSENIKNGKEEIKNNMSEKIESLYQKQESNISKIEKYSEKWKEAYNNKEFKKMETNYNKINKLLEETMPIEKVFTEARKIENLHTLIKNNNQSFELSEEEKELAEKIIN